jgi:hypothetical protein
MIPRFYVHITFLVNRKQTRPHFSRDGAHAAYLRQPRRCARHHIAREISAPS